jgi:hypothetical protein
MELNSEGPGAPSFVVWKYPGIGATRRLEKAKGWGARSKVFHVEHIDLFELMGIFTT